MEVAKTFAATALLSGTAATVFTADVDHRAHVTHLHAFNNHTVAVNLTVSKGTDAAGTRIYDQVSVQPKGWHDDTGLYVFEAAEFMQAFASVANKITLTIEGVEVATQ